MKEALRLPLTGLALALAAVVSGCSDLTVITMSSDKTQEQTAAVLGIPPDDVKISNLQEDTSHVYYEATTRDGKKYNCTARLLKPPTCTAEKW